MLVNEIEVETADGPMSVYGAAPDEQATRAVVVVQEAFGVNEHIKDVTRRFAAAGYRAVAPAFFHRVPGPPVEDYSDFGSVMPFFAGVSDEGGLVDLDATLDVLHEEGFDDRSIGIVGFCFGGRFSFLTAATHALGAAVGFYGAGIVSPTPLPTPPLIDRAGELRTPWLGLFGEQDTSIPVEDVERLRAALQQASVATEIVRYPDAGHGFHCDARDAYHEPSAKDGWARCLAWLDQHLTP